MHDARSSPRPTAARGAGTARGSSARRGAAGTAPASGTGRGAAEPDSGSVAWRGDAVDVVDLAEDHPRPLHHRFAGLGQQDLTRFRSTSSTPSSFSSFFTCMDSVGWRHEAGAGRLAEVPVVGEGDEVLQIAKVHDGASDGPRCEEGLRVSLWPSALMIEAVDRDRLGNRVGDRVAIGRRGTQSPAASCRYSPRISPSHTAVSAWTRRSMSAWSV